MSNHRSFKSNISDPNSPPWFWAVGFCPVDHHISSRLSGESQLDTIVDVTRKDPTVTNGWTSKGEGTRKEKSVTKFKTFCQNELTEYIPLTSVEPSRFKLHRNSFVHFSSSNWGRPLISVTYTVSRSVCRDTSLFHWWLKCLYPWVTPDSVQYCGLLKLSVLLFDVMSYGTYVDETQDDVFWLNGGPNTEGAVYTTPYKQVVSCTRVWCPRHSITRYSVTWPMTRK